MAGTKKKKVAKSKSDPDQELLRRIKSGQAMVEKQFGKGAIVRLDKPEDFPEVEVISTGSIVLDHVLGRYHPKKGRFVNCGVPRGRITEMFGPEGGGKSTLALHVIAEANRMGEYAAYIDNENAFDPDYAAEIGVDIKRLLVSQPESGEEALTIAQVMIRTGGIAVIVIDSVAMLVPKSELEGEIGDQHVGTGSRLLTQFIKKLKADVMRANVAMICVNQVRDKIGVTFGSKETTPMGRTLKHMSQLRIDVRRISQLKKKDAVIGSLVYVKTPKNRQAAPFRRAALDLIFGKGFSKESELVDLGVKYKVLKKIANTHSYNGADLGNGREQTREELVRVPELAVSIEKDILAAMLEEARNGI